jgi:lipoprotein-anchoring transpeptidase ErfK/SrfK
VSFSRKQIAAALLLLTGGAATTMAAGAPSEEAVAPVRLEVDISERVLYVHHNGEVMNTFPVAVGEPGHPTPTGDFNIDRLIWDPSWVPPNAEWAEDREKKDPADPDNPMEAAKLFFKYPDYYIHGTDATHTLGEAESHGCVRMRPADVEQLAKFVQEHGGEHRSDAWYERVMSREEPKVEISLSDPVDIDIHQ